MTVKKLHEITGHLIARNRGDADVAVDLATFIENEEATIHPIVTSMYRRVQGVDDSGPTGPKFPFLVLGGEFEEAVKEALKP